MNYNLPYFGNLELNALKGDYYVVAEIAKRNVPIELSFEKKTINQEIAEGIARFLENIEKQDQRNRDYIAKDFEERESETANYINFYVTEFNETELGIDSEKKDLEKQLLHKLELNRVAIYPDGKYGATYYAMFDYTIYLDGLPCDQLLVVFTDKQGGLFDIGWDS